MGMVAVKPMGQKQVSTVFALPEKPTVLEFGPIVVRDVLKFFSESHDGLSLWA